MLDVIIPLGAGSKWDNNELRYCLRSIERVATGYGRVFVIGENPGWLNGATALHQCKDIAANKEARIAHKIFWAFQNTDISDKAVLFNDDYVLTNPVDLREVPYAHRESLTKAAAKQSSEAYRECLLATHRALSEAGRPVWHYDIHFPMILERDKFLSLEKWWQQSLFSKVGLVVKSIYANNVLPEPGPRIVDCKLRGPSRNIDEAVKGRWVFSYDDHGLTPALKQWLANKFPAKCSFEA